MQPGDSRFTRVRSIIQQMRAGVETVRRQRPGPVEPITSATSPIPAVAKPLPQHGRYDAIVAFIEAQKTAGQLTGQQADGILEAGRNAIHNRQPQNEQEWRVVVDALVAAIEQTNSALGRALWRFKKATPIPARPEQTSLSK